MQKELNDLIEFSEAFGMHYQRNYLFQVPERVRQLRKTLITEEAKEVAEELDKTNNLQDLAKELADLLYVTYGTIVSYGLQEVMPKVFEEVHRSNMSKLEDGKVLRREDGKALKGKHYSPADINSILQ